MVHFNLSPVYTIFATYINELAKMAFKSIKKITTALLLLIALSSQAQELITRYELSGTYGGGNHTPFWHMGNDFNIRILWYIICNNRKIWYNGV